MRVALWGNDLILASQVQAVARDAGVEFTLCRGADVPASDVVFVDLNFDDSGITTIGQVRAAQPEANIVGFCGHEEKVRRQRAMEAGASSCVTNGSVAATARRLMAS